MCCVGLENLFPFPLVLVTSNSACLLRDRPFSNKS